MTFETEESRSSLDMKLYVMPKKASGLSWAFCFSWLTVYTSVMDSTAETKPATHVHVCSLFFGKQAMAQAALCHLIIYTRENKSGDLLTSFLLSTNPMKRPKQSMLLLTSTSQRAITTCKYIVTRISNFLTQLGAAVFKKTDFNRSK